ncbi:hypothetical protein WH47_12097 [Habropoda laboriosa]|uniref:Uncharacterized protein n=1 Tax=Habropoda laboriosa TaxID=597456 RepID=A0A0L7R1B1_9HYME|nr:hypothetical protein WH47_12097 [Habropoda laboriosa]
MCFVNCTYLACRAGKKLKDWKRRLVEDQPQIVPILLTYKCPREPNIESPTSLVQTTKAL